MEFDANLADAYIRAELMKRDSNTTTTITTRLAG
jgi:hypothetical protein